MIKKNFTATISSVQARRKENRWLTIRMLRFIAIFFLFPQIYLTSHIMMNMNKEKKSWKIKPIHAENVIPSLIYVRSNQTDIIVDIMSWEARRQNMMPTKWIHLLTQKDFRFLHIYFFSHIQSFMWVHGERSGKRKLKWMKLATTWDMSFIKWYQAVSEYINNIDWNVTVEKENPSNSDIQMNCNTFTHIQ